MNYIWIIYGYPVATALRVFIRLASRFAQTPTVRRCLIPLITREPNPTASVIEKFDIERARGHHCDTAMEKSRREHRDIDQR